MRWQETPGIDHDVTSPDGWRLCLRHYARPRDQPARRKHPVLLCHGLGASRVYLDAHPKASIAKHLIDQGFEVFAMEFRGSGRSQKRGPKSWGLWDLVERDVPAHVAAVREMTGAHKLHFVGHSLGGILMFLTNGRDDTAYASGTAIGSTLDYSGSGSAFQKLRHLIPLTRPMRTVPLQLRGKLFAAASRLGPRFMDAMQVAPHNVEREVYAVVERHGNYPISSKLLRDLAPFFKPGGVAAHMPTGARAPTMSMAGTLDLQCPPKAAARFGDEVRAYGRAHGHLNDYGHCDLITGLHAPAETWPDLVGWLERHEL